MSSAVATLSLPVSIVISIGVPVASVNITRFSSDVGAMILVIILVGVGDYTANGTVDTVSVGNWTVVGLVVNRLTVITTEEIGAGKGGMSGIGDLAVRTDTGGGGGGDRCGCISSLTDMRALSS